VAPSFHATWGNTGCFVAHLKPFTREIGLGWVYVSWFFLDAFVSMIYQGKRTCSLLTMWKFIKRWLP
jgi:hypothetical protein